MGSESGPGSVNLKMEMETETEAEAVFMVIPPLFTLFPPRLPLSLIIIIIMRMRRNFYFPAFFLQRESKRQVVRTGVRGREMRKENDIL